MRRPVRICSRMCADQPATRAHAKNAGKSGGGMSAMSSTTADQNSTFVARTRSGWRAASSSRAACSSCLGDLDARRLELARGSPQDACARVLGAVDAVAEAHDPLAAVE